MSDLDRFHSSVRKARTIALVVGVIGALACLGLAFTQPTIFFRGYLVGYVLWCGVSIGCLGWTLINHLTGGDWGKVMRGPFEGGLSAFPLLIVLFLPLAVPMVLHKDVVWPWTDHDYLHTHHHVGPKTAYLNANFFLIRAAVYFAVWIITSRILLKFAPRRNEPGAARFLTGFSGGGMVALMLTITFASVDWMMSLEPMWFSTLYGMYSAVCFGLSALSLATLTASWGIKRGAMDGEIHPDLLHDLGKLLFMIVTLYTYLAFSQFLIMWSGNLPEETIWYAHRGATTFLPDGSVYEAPGAAFWRFVPVILFGGHFVIPFVVLLSKHMKRRLAVVTTMAAVIFAMHVLDLIWMIVPAWGESSGSNPGMTSLAALIASVGVGGLWLWVYFGSMLKREWPAPVVGHGNHHHAPAAHPATEAH